MTEQVANRLLVSVSFVWGLSYLFMKALATMPLLMVVALRCGIAFLLLAVIFHDHLRRLDWQVLSAGAICGLLLSGVFLGLLYGVKYTSASETAFLTNTTVVIVPILQVLITHQWPARYEVISLLVVLLGLAILTGGFQALN